MENKKDVLSSYKSVKSYRQKLFKVISSAETNELTHHGTKGMKWGVRRYQNKDGSLTAEGKNRSKKKPEDMTNEELIKANTRAKQIAIYKKNNPDANDLEANSTAKKLGLAGDVTKVTGEAIKNQGVSIAQQVRKWKNAKNMDDVNSLSTAELRSKTERLIAENNYVNASMARTNATQQKVEATLSIFGSALAVGGAALSLASSWKKYKSGD